jgi:hypothetical protein
MAPRPASEKVRPKKSYFSSACEYVKLPFSSRVPKKSLIRLMLFNFFVCFILKVVITFKERPLCTIFIFLGGPSTPTALLTHEVCPEAIRRNTFLVKQQFLFVETPDKNPDVRRSSRGPN